MLDSAPQRAAPTPPSQHSTVENNQAMPRASSTSNNYCGPSSSKNDNHNVTMSQQQPSTSTTTKNSNNESWKSWRASILFPLDKGATGKLELLDLCPMIGKTYKELGWPKLKAFIEIHRPHRYYFDVKKYPPPLLCQKQQQQQQQQQQHTNGQQRLSRDCKSFQKLKVDLQNAGQLCGSPMASAGSTGSKVNDRVFRCAIHNRIDRNNRNSDNDKQNTNDSKNSKKKKTKKRKDASSHTQEEPCKFRIGIAWDQYGFYLKQNIGCPHHNAHPPKFSIPDARMKTRILQEQQQQQQQQDHEEGEDDDDDKEETKEERVMVDEMEQQDNGTIAAASSVAAPQHDNKSYHYVITNGDHVDLCNLLDEVHSLDPEKAEELFTRKRELDVEIKEKCRDYLREKRRRRQRTDDNSSDSNNPSNKRQRK